MKQKLLSKWDFFVYRMAYRSLSRMMKSNSGFVYLFELHLKKYREENPLPKSLETSTEYFFNALEEWPAK